MATTTVTLFAEADAWRVGVASRAGVKVVDAPIAPGAGHDARVAALTDALRAAGVDRGAEVVLALRSRDCLCAPVDTAGLPSRNRGQAMLYRLEERLPVAAEEVVADFVPPVDRDAASQLGVAVERRLLEPIVAAVEAAGLSVGAICPAALLVLQSGILGIPDVLGVPGKIGPVEFALFGGGEPGYIELFVRVGGQPAAWYVVPAEPDAVALHVRMALLRYPNPTWVWAWGVAPEVVRRVTEVGLTVQPRSSKPPEFHEAATDAGRFIATGRERPLVDLSDGGAAGGRGSRAARGARAWAAVAAFVLLGSVAAGTFWRAARFERLAARYEAEQQDAFRRALPGQPMPADVRSRLASEARQGGRGGAGSAGVGGGGADGLVTLRDLMTFLPADVRFRVHEVRLDGDAFTLEGEVKTHGDAEAVAAALRRRAGFEVEPPRTEQRPGRGVGFTITGGVAVAAARPDAPGGQPSGGRAASR